MPLSVADVMQRSLRTVPPEMRVADLEQWFVGQRLSGAPVVEGGRVVGVVSRADLVRQLVVEQSQVESMALFYLEPFDADQHSAADDARIAEAVASRWQKLQVRDLMIDELITVPADRSLEAAARLLLERRIHRLLVTEGETLVGLLSSLDLVRLFAEGKVAAA